MARASHGWNIIIFLLVMTIVVLLATNCFNIASHMYMTSRMRYRHHQEVRLLEGLLKYGIHICNGNKELLLRWGAHEPQTMYLDFNTWPSKSSQFLLGNHAGVVHITSEKGIIHVYAQLLKENKYSLSGSCDLKLLDTKKPQGCLYVINWSIDKKVAIKENEY